MTLEEELTAWRICSYDEDMMKDGLLGITGTCRRLERRALTDRRAQVILLYYYHLFQRTDLICTRVPTVMKARLPIEADC